MYLTPTLLDGVAKIRRAVELRQGLCCIFGDNGYGKSSLLRHLLAALEAEPNNKVALIAESTDAPKFAFLRSLSKEFHIPPQRSAVAQLSVLEDYLIEQYDAGKNVIIMIDEAQLLRLESLESIRSLLNFETNTEKLCQVILAGQLELRDKMFHKRYKAFRSRIIAPVVLEYFTLEETTCMIDYRHTYWRVPNRFSANAVHRVHEVTKGVPRDIVVVCGYAYSEAEDREGEISSEDISRAADRLTLRSAREAAA
jgi:general secretion pathway protein A